jgi:DNA-binding IclR family transcriptional regulator
MAAVKTQTAPAVDRALAILEILASSRAGLTLPELVEKSCLPRSSVHYLLVTLERRGYLERNHRTGRYLFSTKLLDLARGAVEGLSIAEQFTPHLWRLTQATGLAAQVAILQDDEAVLVAKVDPPRAAGGATWPGKRLALHSTAAGKVLLAGLEEGRALAIARERGMPRHNENTIATLRALKQELARVRLLGYAVDAEEDELGTVGLAVPVQDERGQTLAAIGVSGAVGEMAAERRPQLLLRLGEAAGAIGRAMGDAGMTRGAPLGTGRLVERVARA